MKTKIYIPTEDRTNYTTSFWNKNNEIIYLKEIELDIPTDEELKSMLSKRYKAFDDNGELIFDYSDFDLNKFEGAKYLREQITNQLKNK